MPPYELDELLVIGKHMHEHAAGGEEIELLAEELIRERFRKYGGNIRRVLPDFWNRVQYEEDMLEGAVSGLTMEQLFTAVRTNMEDKVDSYLMQWRPKAVFRGSTAPAPALKDKSQPPPAEDEPPAAYFNFAALETVVASDYVLSQALDQLKLLNLDALLMKLSDLLFLANMKAPLRYYLEVLLQKIFGRNSDVREVLSFDALQPGMLCYPNTTERLPGCEMYYREGSTLHLFHCAVPDDKEVSDGAMAEMLDKIGFPTDAGGAASIKYTLVMPPTATEDKFSISDTTYDTGALQKRGVENEALIAKYADVMKTKLNAIWQFSSDFTIIHKKESPSKCSA